MQNHMEFSQKIKNQSTIWSSQNHFLEEISALPSHWSMTYNGQDIETVYQSIDR